MSPEQRHAYDLIAAGPRGSVRGPLLAWLQRPRLAAVAQELGAYCRYETLLDKRLMELAVLVVAAEWRSGYEWAGHAPLAIAAGLRGEDVKTLLAGERPSFARMDEQIVYQFAHELVHTHMVAPQTWMNVEALLGTAGVTDLVAVIGYYHLVAITINAFEIPVPDGRGDVFAPSAVIAGAAGAKEPADKDKSQAEEKS